jgi:limonene 1,2-monooxygenase
LERDLALAQHLDNLGFDELWVGEHHSSGWETIASPEMFLAVAGDRTKRIRLGTGVVSLPYHHPLMVAERIVMLDHMTRGRAMLGTGPGVLTFDMEMLGIDPMVTRDRQEEAVAVLVRLLRGEEVTYECEWFKLRRAALQLLPSQEHLEIATTATVTPTGMRIAGKYGLGVLSLGGMFASGENTWVKQWDVAEESARVHGGQARRDGWRIVMNFHLAETRKQAEEEAIQGYKSWHNEYIIATLTPDGRGRIEDPDELLARARQPSPGTCRTTIIGTPDEAVTAILELQRATGGFGCVLGMVHDWADIEAQHRSWALLARYVIPAVNGLTTRLRSSYDATVAHRAEYMGKQLAAMEARMSGQRNPGRIEVPSGTTGRDT